MKLFSICFLILTYQDQFYIISLPLHSVLAESEIMAIEYKSGLKILVSYHRWTGNSYLCWNYRKPLSHWMKILILILNLIMFGFFVYFSYLTFQELEEYSKNKILFENQKKKIAFIMRFVVIVGYTLIDFFVFGSMLIEGKSIIMYLYDLDIGVDSKVERKIGLTIMIVQLIFVPVLESGFLISPLAFSATQNFRDKFSHYLLYVVVCHVHLSMLSLIAYYCYVMQAKLKEINMEFTSLVKLPVIYKELLSIYNSVQRFDNFFNTYLFLYIVSHSINLVINSVILYFDRCTMIVDALASFTESIIMMFIVCYLSDRIGKAYAMVISRLNQLECSTDTMILEKLNYNQINRLYNIRDDMCLTAFNLYPINIKTFIQIMSLVITFTVILIQTTY